MNNLVDMLFKAAAVALLAVFVWLYAQGRDIGRYAYLKEGDLEYVLDTATGVVYQGGYSMNHLTGKEGPAGK
ncbi:MAG: hypothetical protein ACOZEN_13310 [Thermodesulfobacteriota bacterium]